MVIIFAAEVEEGGETLKFYQHEKKFGAKKEG